ncbi:MAG: hypothetical protein Q8K78_05205 [Planctomycetaceae bacterium]|nr:hypothetical protein [Planctomycetaceae bacterium]
MISKRKKPRKLQPRDIPHGNTKYTDDDVVAAVQRLAAEHGDELTLHTFRRATGIGTTTIQTRFGGWLALRERAGLHHRKSYLVRARVHCASSLVRQLQEVVKETGPHLNLMEFCERAGVSSTTIQRYCGTWNKLRLAAGLPVRPKRQRLYSELDLLFELHRLVQHLGEFPTSEQLDRHGRFCYATYHARYGSMLNLRKRYHQFATRLNRAIANAAFQ